MKTCSFFGHRDYRYEEMNVLLQDLLTILIEEYDVRQFYSGGRGNFDRFGASNVGVLRKRYFADVRNTLVYSYIPVGKERTRNVPDYYTDTVYLLEKFVPPKFAISYTNQEMIDRSDYIVTGVLYSWGGARKAVEYAQRKQKPIFNLHDYMPLYREFCEKSM